MSTFFWGSRDSERFGARHWCHEDQRRHGSLPTFQGRVHGSDTRGADRPRQSQQCVPSSVDSSTRSSSLSFVWIRQRERNVRTTDWTRFAALGLLEILETPETKPPVERRHCNHVSELWNCPRYGRAVASDPSIRFRSSFFLTPRVLLYTIPTCPMMLVSFVTVVFPWIVVVVSAQHQLQQDMPRWSSVVVPSSELRQQDDEPQQRSTRGQSPPRLLDTWELVARALDATSTTTSSREARMDEPHEESSSRGKSRFSKPRGLGAKETMHEQHKERKTEKARGLTTSGMKGSIAYHNQGKAWKFHKANTTAAAATNLEDTEELVHALCDMWEVFNEMGRHENRDLNNPHWSSLCDDFESLDKYLCPPRELVEEAICTHTRPYLDPAVRTRYCQPLTSYIVDHDSFRDKCVSWCTNYVSHARGNCCEIGCPTPSY